MFVTSFLEQVKLLYFFSPITGSLDPYIEVRIGNYRGYKALREEAKPRVERGVYLFEG